MMVALSVGLGINMSLVSPVVRPLQKACLVYDTRLFFTWPAICWAGAETGLVLFVPGTTNNSVNVIQNGLKIIH